jgi:hypothetical protein
MWSIDRIVDAVERGLELESSRIEEEQSVYGLDSHREVALQTMLATALETAGFGVHREQRYPEYRRCRRASEGQRCDLVLTPRARPLDMPEQAPTLFDPPEAVPLCDAYWLEVKIVAQCRPGGTNHRYSSTFGPLRRDIAKLHQHKGIRHRGLLILMFAQDLVVADHDLAVWRAQCDERGLPMGEPSLRAVTLGDRVGNTTCRVGLFPVHRETEQTNGGTGE